MYIWIEHIALHHLCNGDHVCTLQMCKSDAGTCNYENVAAYHGIDNEMLKI